MLGAKVVKFNKRLNSAIHYGKLDISLDVCILLFDADTINCLQCIYYVVVFPQDALMHFVNKRSPCTFINVLASNYVMKLVNTGTSTCQSTLDR